VSAPRALVTGGSRGIGLAVAGALAGRGWSVTILARDAAACEQAAATLPGSAHSWFALDVADEPAWDALAPELGGLNGLVCAAGTLAPVGPVGTYAADAFRRTLEVNLLGTLLAIQTCLPALRASGGSIVTFSGGGATAPLPRFDAYAASKAAVVRLTENLSSELEREGVRINSVAPGFVATDIHRATLEAGPDLAGAAYHERTARDLAAGGVPATEAAELSCALLDPDAEERFTGRLISAQWDPWREASFGRRLVAEPDLGTLRRIDGVMFAACEPQGQS